MAALSGSASAVGNQRFHLRAELFLHLDVGPALPLLRLAHFLDARGDRGAHGLQAHGEIVAVLLHRQRSHRAHGELRVLEQAFGVLEREVLGRGARFEIRHERLQALEVALLRLRAPFAVLLLSGLERLRRGVVASRQLGGELGFARDRLPLLLQGVPLRPDGAVVGVASDGFDFCDHFWRALDHLARRDAPLVPLLGGAARGLEPLLQIRRPRLRHAGHPFPRRAGGRQPIGEVVAVEAFDVGAEIGAVRLLFRQLLRTPLGGGTRGIVSRKTVAHAIRQRFELRHGFRQDFGVGEKLDPRDAERRVGLANGRDIRRRAKRLHLAAQVQRALLVGLPVLGRGLLGGRTRGGFALALQHPRALLHGFGTRALREPGQRLVGCRLQPLQRDDGGVGVLAARRDGFELGWIGDLGDGQQPGVGIAGVTGNAAERFVVRHLLDGGLANAVDVRRARSACELARPPERGQRGDGAERRPFVAGFGQLADARQRLLAHGFVAFVARDDRQDPGVRDTGEHGPAHTRVGIVGRHGGQRLLIACVDFVKAFEPDGRVSVLPLRLGAELFEESHGISPQRDKVPPSPLISVRMPHGSSVRHKRATNPTTDAGERARNTVYTVHHFM